ncbi:MAG: sulfite oxidase-like oxidoreductase [Verrucomicrobiae bacterium]|nr:sulfite oxidase-like oxidoreductase [Verrucomicrobiae bacterium]
MDEFKERLIKGKERIAESGKAKRSSGRRLGAPTGSRLPPGQHEVKHWPVLDLGAQPDVSLHKWTLTIDGFVEKPTVLAWQDFLSLPQVEMVRDFHCVTTWSRFENHWKGVEFKSICNLVEPKPNAKFLFFTAYDGYTTNLSLDAALDDLLLVHEWEGKPLTLEHGSPVRGVLSKIYAWKGVKWIKQITFLDQDKLGFWEVRGYSNTADPFKEERFS